MGGAEGIGDAGIDAEPGGEEDPRDEYVGDEAAFVIVAGLFTRRQDERSGIVPRREAGERRAQAAVVTDRPGLALAGEKQIEVGRIANRAGVADAGPEAEGKVEHRTAGHGLDGVWQRERCQRRAASNTPRMGSMPGRRLSSVVGALVCGALLVGCGAMSVGGTPEGAPPPTVAPSVYVPTPQPSQFREGTPPAEPVASTASIPAERLPVAEFVADGRVLARLPVEVLPHGEFSVGLSGRMALGERGMLFDYGSAGQDGPFWMKNTHIDLDIAFIDDQNRIVSVRTMQAESLDYVYSSAPYRSAIEAPAHWYASRGIREGHTVRYVDPPESPSR